MPATTRAALFCSFCKRLNSSSGRLYKRELQKSSLNDIKACTSVRSASPGKYFFTDFIVFSWKYPDPKVDIFLKLTPRFLADDDGSMMLSDKFVMLSDKLDVGNRLGATFRS